MDRVSYNVQPNQAPISESIVLAALKFRFEGMINRQQEISMSRREQYQAKLKANLATLEAEIKKLSVKANKAKSDAKVKLDMELAVLKAQQQVAKARFNALRRASDEAWGDIKAGADQAWKDLSKAFSAARKRFAKS